MRKPPIPPFYERHPLFVLVLLYAVMAAVSLWSRSYWFGSIIPGTESYYHSSVTQLVLSRGLNPMESLMGVMRPFFITPFHIVSANIAYFFGAFRVARLMPVMLGAFTLGSSWYLLGKLRYSIRPRFFTVLLFMLSPVFWKLSLVYGPEALSLFFIVLGIPLVMSENRLARGLGMLLLWSASLFGLLEALVVGISMYAVSRLRPRQKGIYLFAGLSAVFLFALRAALFLAAYGYPVWPSIFMEPFLTRTFTILGASWGFGFFGLCLGIGGIIISWKSKMRLWPFYTLIGILIISSIFGFEGANIFLSAIFSALGAVMIETLFRREWALPFLKGATLWLLICGLLFSGIIELTLIVRSEPHPDEIGGLTALSELCAPKDVVLSDPSRGFWIESVSGCSPLLDTQTYYVGDAEQRLQDMDTMFKTKDLKLLRGLLDRYEVKYIFVDRAMKEGLVWQKEDEGLLFMLRNNETFKSAYIHPSIEIWEVT